MGTYEWSDPAVLTFVVLPAALVALLLWGVSAAARRLGHADEIRRRALRVTLVTATVWMGGTWAAAQSGILRQWDATPPPFALLVLGIAALAAAMASGTYGRRLATGLPLWVLVLAQGFRLPLEFAMHGMYESGVMPVQMSYSGSNFDVLTGVSALAIAWLVATGRGGRSIVWAWNIAGLALLVNVVTIAILSTPRFAYFGDDRLNVWVSYPPFVWLPAVLVVAALAGHLLIFRALWPAHVPSVSHV